MSCENYCCGSVSPRDGEWGALPGASAALARGPIPVAVELGGESLDATSEKRCKVVHHAT